MKLSRYILIVLLSAVTLLAPLTDANHIHLNETPDHPCVVCLQDNFHSAITDHGKLPFDFNPQTQSEYASYTLSTNRLVANFQSRAPPIVPHA